MKYQWHLRLESRSSFTGHMSTFRWSYCYAENVPDNTLKKILKYNSNLDLIFPFWSACALKPGISWFLVVLSTFTSSGIFTLRKDHKDPELCSLCLATLDCAYMEVLRLVSSVLFWCAFAPSLYCTNAYLPVKIISYHIIAEVRLGFDGKES